ncbi:MAG: Uma2 family endonuclease, partial [Firmicutes bacterium]|nr:Uma2 family endonuclease [Bacillota bacterium]
SRKPSFRYTIGDYYALPDDLRVELIDGDFYLMEAPSTVHQGIIAELTFLFQLFVRQKQGTCRVFMSPLDVRLLYGQPTILQPDILIICDPAKTKLRGIFGAPDLVIEILSKTSRRKDMGLKLSKYMEAKVKEYWMIDPLQHKVFVYQPEKEEFCTLYSFDEEIPVGIWNGECRINMKEVWERVEGLNQD